MLNTYREVPEAKWEEDSGKWVSFLDIHSLIKQKFIGVPSVCQAPFKALLPATWELLAPYILLWFSSSSSFRTTADTLLLPVQKQHTLKLLGTNADKVFI